MFPFLLGVLLLPCLIVMFWQRRPVLAFVMAANIGFIICVAPGIIQTSQAMMIYGQGDPQLMAGGIASATISGIFGVVIYLPFLFLFQWFGRVRRRKQKRAKIDSQTFN